MTTDLETSAGGLLDSFRRMGRTLIRLLVTRLEILSTEIAEEELNLARLAIVGSTVLFCVQMGLALSVLFVILAAGPEHRLVAIGAVALVLLLGALAGGWWLRWWLRNRPPIFAGTIAELRRDFGRSGDRP